MYLKQQPNLTPTTLFNPALRPFHATYDKKPYVIQGMDFETFPKWLADKLAPRLADWIIAEQGVKENYQLDKENLLKQIYVK